MDAVIYTTNQYGEYISKPLFCGEYLEGITTASKFGNANSGFIGFGVAITGSSCYNLSLMEPADRNKLLRKLYTEEGLNFQIGDVV